MMATPYPSTGRLPSDTILYLRYSTLNGVS